jgi:hypothetical protein
MPSKLLQAIICHERFPPGNALDNLILMCSHVETSNGCLLLAIFRDDVSYIFIRLGLY